MTNDKAQATQRPWARGIESDSERVQIITVTGEHVCYIERDSVEEHADILLRAVNSHEALVEALRQADERLRRYFKPFHDCKEFHDYCFDCWTVEILRESQAALKLAEGGAK